jgi:repressor LexA
MAELLSRRQAQVLKFILTEVRHKGTMPSIRDICRHFNFRSLRSAQLHLEGLVRKGYLVKDPSGRGVHLPSSWIASIQGVPILGRVRAGKPIDDEDFLGMLDIPTVFGTTQNLIAYKVEGDSMSGAGINHGDYVMVRTDLEAQNRQIALVWLQNQGITVKRLLYKGDKLILKAENPVYQDLVLQLPFDPDDLANEIRIIGKVIGIVKKL